MAVQYKVMASYYLPLNAERTTFNMFVLELVKLIQIALHHHGLYGMQQGEVIDGLLCDSTMQGLIQWFKDMNADDAKLHDTDRVSLAAG
jgi:hypothetical protein